MVRFFSVFLFLLLVSGVAFASPTPYGPGYGFNTAPDLGRVLTLDELQGKVSYEWFHNRFRTLFARHDELKSLDPAKWAHDAYRLAKSGQFVENSLPVGALIKDVSFTGGNWSANRIWTAAPGQVKAPQGVWDLSMVDANGVALKIVIAKRCGNLEYIGCEVVAKAPPTPVAPPPVAQDPDIPQKEITLRVPPTAYFYGQYRPMASAQSRIFQPKPVSPVSSLHKTRINNGNNISLSQSQSQSQTQPTRSMRISTFANGGGGYGNADAAASASSSASATAVGAGAAGGGPGGGGGAEVGVGTSTADSTATSTGTATESGGWGGDTGILIEGEW